MKMKVVTAIGAFAGIGAAICLADQHRFMAGIATGLACVNVIWLAVLVFESAWHGNSR